MTANQRIALNIIATYGRSLFSLACGLFVGRWLLATLGEIDYGLYGLIGGLAVFITFFNNILAAAIARFYAYSIGEAQKPGCGAEGLENCRSWFNTAVSLHVVLAVVLMAIGYPIGIYAIKYWLTIPTDRVADCVWVFRWVCVSTFIGMVNVPFNAMYVAKQLIAELTLYSIFTTVMNVLVLFYMVNHPGDWLTWYAFFFVLAAVIPQILIICRAAIKFPECRFVRRYMFARSNIAQLGGFVGWQLIGHLGYLVKGQGIAILVNKLFGPVMNASMAVGAQVSAQTDTLASAMNGAFLPAITTMAGAGDREKMMRMVYRACKLGALMSLFFILPLATELDAILHIWLKNPPPLATELCYFMLAVVAIDEMVRGVGISITANGKLALYYATLGMINILSLPLAWLVVKLGWCSCVAVMAVLAIVKLASAFIAVIIAERVVGLSFKVWLSSVFAKCCLVSLAALTAGLGMRYLLFDSYWMRILGSLCVTTIIFAISSWFGVLTSDERSFILSRIKVKMRGANAES